MQLTKNIITREEALKLAPDYVAFVEQHALSDAILNPFMWDYDKLDGHGYATHGVKVGQDALTYFDGQFVRVKITSTKQPGHDADGPVVRVGNGEYTWRVDGAKYAFIIPKQPRETLVAA